MNTAPLPARLRTPWYRERWPWLLMAGPALVVVAGLYTGWLAVTSDDGVVAEDYYKRGLAINQRLERVERAAALKLSAIVDVAGDGDVRVTLASPSPSPEARPAIVRIAITHPTRAGQDRGAELVLGPDGRYAGRVEPLPKGRWLVMLETDAWRLPVVEVDGVIRDVRLPRSAAAHS